MPMFFACRDPIDIAWMNLFNRSTPPLYTTETRRDKQRLTKWVSMPCSSRTRLKGDVAA